MSPLLYAAFAGLLLGAAACFGAGRAASARTLGIGAAAAALTAAVLVALAPLGAPGAPPMVLLTIGELALSVDAGLSAGGRAIAAALLGGGAAALLALAGAIAPGVRGFGAIFGWGLMALAAALLSLAAPVLSSAQPLAWAVVSLAGHAALRASGATDGETPPLGLGFGMLANVLLTGGLLAMAVSQDAGAQPGWPEALCGLLAALALAGAPPLAVARVDMAEAPAPLGALVFGLAAPAAALGWLLRASAELPLMPSTWAYALGIIGALGVAACSAGALGARSLRGVLTWVGAGQAAAVVAAMGLAGPLAALAGPGLLVTLLLSSALGAGAAATLERTTGSDDYTTAGPPPPLAAGVAWALASAAALGLPPLWGFWPRLWLLQAAEEQQPWLLLPLLGGGVLLALALVAPLGRLWGGAGRPRAGWADTAPAAFAGLPLVALGLAPGLAWAVWLRELPLAPDAPPATVGAQLAATVAGVALVALLAGVLRAPSDRTLPRDPDEQATYLGPDALGETLRPLAWVASPLPLLVMLWEGARRASEALRFVMGLFEQRYYLLGVLAAILTIMLLMAQ